MPAISTGESWRSSPRKKMPTRMGPITTSVLVRLEALARPKWDPNVAEGQKHKGSDAGDRDQHPHFLLLPPDGAEGVGQGAEASADKNGQPWGEEEAFHKPRSYRREVGSTTTLPHQWPASAQSRVMLAQRGVPPSPTWLAFSDARLLRRLCLLR